MSAGWVAAAPLGCVAASYELLGAAMSGAEAGASVTRAGKIETLKQIEFDAAVAAAQAVVDRLGFTKVAVDEEIRDRVFVFRVEDELRNRVTIAIRRHTPVVTRVRIAVGLLGSDALAAFVMNEIAGEIDRMTEETTIDGSRGAG